MIQVINRALDILEYMTNDPETPKTLSEIAHHLALNPGTCANIIKTLVARKYIDKEDKRKGYYLGIMAYKLTNNYNYTSSLVSAAKHEIELLTKKINENSLCAVLKKESRVAIAKASSNQDLQANTSSEKHAYNSASGRLLVAMLPNDELDNFIELYGPSGQEFWKCSKDKETFMKEIKKIRRYKYAVQITPKQIVGIAIPIYTSNHVIASLSVYLPAIRFNKGQKAALLKSMRTTAQKIEKNLSN